MPKAMKYLQWIADADRSIPSKFTLPLFAAQVTDCAYRRIAFVCGDSSFDGGKGVGTEACRCICAFDKADPRRGARYFVTRIWNCPSNWKITYVDTLLRSVIITMDELIPYTFSVCYSEWAKCLQPSAALGKYPCDSLSQICWAWGYGYFGRWWCRECLRICQCDMVSVLHQGTAWSLGGPSHRASRTRWSGILRRTSRGAWVGMDSLSPNQLGMGNSGASFDEFHPSWQLRSSQPRASKTFGWNIKHSI